MKKLFILLMIVLFSSCNFLFISDYTWQIPEKITTVEEALGHVRTCYTYKIVQYCDLPKEFYYKGYGDCSEYTLMLQYLFETQLGIEAFYIRGNLFQNGCWQGHAWIEANNIKYEPMLGVIILDSSNYIETKRHSYEEAITMVQKYGGFLK